MMRNSPDRYGAVAMTLHWLIAAMVLINIGLGLYFVDLPQDFPGKSLFTQTHKSIGLTVLMLSVVRLYWRLMNPPPPLPAGTGAFVRITSKTVHWIFYFLLIAIPLAGWSIVSVSPLGIPTQYFWQFVWPHIGFLNGLSMDERRALLPIFVNIHNTLAFLAALLIAIHVGAALYHHFIRKDSVLRRMLPWTRG
jgi:cytochrome b561